MSEKIKKKNDKNKINERIDWEKHDEILEIYKKIKTGIEKAIKGYKKAWKGTEKEVFAEMAFCILTPQSKAKNAWLAITNLVENGLLYNGKAEEMVEFLNIVRFKNNKSRYLVELRKLMTRNGELQPKKILSEIGDTFEKRKWILKNVKGMGLKEANHVLRNLGFGENIAILDRHILRNLKALNVIEEIPKSITEKKYYEIEEKMRNYSKFCKIDMDELEKVALEKKETRNNIMGYRLPNDNWINVIAEGRLVNIAAADGHPAEIMDMSFAVQAMSALYVKENHMKLNREVIDVSKEIDDDVARLKLEAWDIEIDKLTEEQEAYLNSWDV